MLWERVAERAKAGRCEGMRNENGLVRSEVTEFQQETQRVQRPWEQRVIRRCFCMAGLQWARLREKGLAEGRLRAGQEENWGRDPAMDEAAHAHQGQHMKSLKSHGKMSGLHARCHAQVVLGKEITHSDQVIWGSSGCTSREDWMRGQSGKTGQ